MGMSGKAIEAQGGDESSTNTGSSVLLTLQQTWYELSFFHHITKEVILRDEEREKSQFIGWMHNLILVWVSVAGTTSAKETWYFGDSHSLYS